MGNKRPNGGILARAALAKQLAAASDRSPAIAGAGLLQKATKINKRKCLFALLEKCAHNGRRVPQTRVLVLECLLQHANAGTKVAYPSQIRIARAIGKSKRTVIRAIADLQRFGLIQVAKTNVSPRHTVAAYAIAAACFVTPSTGYTSSRKPTLVASKRSACDKYLKQNARATPQATPPAPLDARAVDELVAAGLSRSVAQRETLAIGGALVLRRLMQARKRPAFLRGELRNPAGYIRTCIRNDFAPPSTRVYRDDDERFRARNYAIGMASEADHQRLRAGAAIAARDFLQILRAKGIT